MSNRLPNPHTLKEAVQEVIRQNNRIGYPPVRFLQATEDGNASNLIQVCTNLIFSDNAVKELERDVTRFPNLLTLEDLVVKSEFGSQWDFDEDSIQRAKETVNWLDSQPGRRQWEI